MYRCKWILIFLPALLKGKINGMFLFSSQKTLTSSKDCSESRIKFVIRISLAFIFYFLRSTLTARFRNNFQNHRRFSERLLGSYQKAGTSYQKRVTGSIATISKQAETLFNFFFKKTGKNCENHQRSFKKYFFPFQELKQIYSFVTQSLYSKHTA